MSVKDVSGLNDDLFITRLVCDRRECKRDEGKCTYARAKEENKSNVRMKSCDLYQHDLRVTMQLSHQAKARDWMVIAVETISSNGNEVQRRFILGVGQRTNRSYIHVC